MKAAIAHKLTSVLPPKHRDWKPGAHQLGLFIRFPGGELIELSVHSAKDDEIATARALLKLLTRSEKDRE